MIASHPDVLRDRAERIAETLSAVAPPELPSFIHDRWLALSGLQKGIRRGNLSLALKCVRTLLTHEPEVFWRRLAIIAYEDIGVGNLDLVADVMSISGRRAWRKQVGGDWKVAAYFVERMCITEKDRTCDDLVALADWHPSLKTARARFRDEKLPLGLQLIAGTGCITAVDAAAIWQRIGSRRYRAENIPAAPGCYRELLVAYEAAGYPPQLIELCRLGLTRMSFALPAFLPVVFVAARKATAHKVALRRSPLIRGIPAFVFDWFTRIGREAIRVWAFSDLGLRSAMPWFDEKADPVRAAAMAVFQLEGGRVNVELRWPDRQRIADQTTAGLLTSAGLPENKVTDFVGLCRKRLPVLDEIRAIVVARRTSQLFLPLEDQRDV